MSSFKTLSLLATTAMLLVACSSTPKPAPEVAPAPKPVVQAPVAPPPAPVQQALKPQPVQPVVLPAHLDPNSAISTKRNVFFDYDKFEIKPEFQQLIEAQGKYLAANGRLAIRVEGNADERGGAEYNLALGQKRAEAVVRALKVYGVKDAQLEAVSWGKEKPRAAGHDEASWSQNRRVDLVYPTK